MKYREEVIERVRLRGIPTAAAEARKQWISLLKYEHANALGIA
jgi:hypothetical protein